MTFRKNQHFSMEQYVDSRNEKVEWNDEYGLKWLCNNISVTSLECTTRPSTIPAAAAAASLPTKDQINLVDTPLTITAAEQNSGFLSSLKPQCDILDDNLAIDSSSIDFAPFENLSTLIAAVDEKKYLGLKKITEELIFNDNSSTSGGSDSGMDTIENNSNCNDTLLSIKGFDEYQGVRLTHNFDRLPNGYFDVDFENQYNIERIKNKETNEGKYIDVVACESDVTGTFYHNQQQCSINSIPIAPQININKNEKNLNNQQQNLKHKDRLISLKSDTIDKNADKFGKINNTACYSILFDIESNIYEPEDSNQSLYESYALLNKAKIWINAMYKKASLKMKKLHGNDQKLIRHEIYRRPRDFSESPLQWKSQISKAQCCRQCAVVVPLEYSSDCSTQDYSSGFLKFDDSYKNNSSTYNNNYDTSYNNNYKSSHLGQLAPSNCVLEETHSILIKASIPLCRCCCAGCNDIHDSLGRNRMRDDSGRKIRLDTYGTEIRRSAATKFTNIGLNDEIQTNGMKKRPTHRIRFCDEVPFLTDQLENIIVVESNARHRHPRSRMLQRTPNRVIAL